MISFQQFYLSEMKLDEGGKSDAIRYNSELGVLYGLIGNGKFNPKRPEKSLPASKLSNPTSCYRDIVRLVAPNFMPNIFMIWANRAPIIKEKILAKQGSLPRKFGWSGGQNIAGGVSDIAFASGGTLGISVKAEGGITLANLSPKALGIQTDKGVDVFDMYAGKEYLLMKQQIFKDVLTAAKRQPNKPLIPISKYGITYVSRTTQFQIKLKTGVLNMSEADIMSAVRKNAQWQRVFGDWFQANFIEKRSYAAPLYNKIAKVFELTMEKNLAKASKLAGILRFGDRPYYYLSAKNLYYVPSFHEVTDLQLKKIRYAKPKGTAQRFIAEIGRADSDDNAELDIYIRYANGMFESNPTVRIQSLKNPQYIGWELL